MGKSSLEQVRQDFLSQDCQFDADKGHIVARIEQIRGKGIIQIQLAPDARETLAVLPSRFRGTIWLRRGAYVTVMPLEDVVAEAKVTHQVENVLSRDHIKALK